MTGSIAADTLINEAIDRFVAIFKGSYESQFNKPHQYKIFSESGEPIAYVQCFVKPVKVRDAEFFHAEAALISSLTEKRLNPTLLWACDDGAYYAKLSEISGAIDWRSRRKGLPAELLVTYQINSSFKYIRY